jgi:hypothetical protein
MLAPARPDNRVTMTWHLGTLARRVGGRAYPVLAPTADVAEADDVLRPAQATRAAVRRAALPRAGQQRLEALRSNVSDTSRRYLDKALAAGHSIATLERLADEWAAKGDDWLRTNLGLFDPPRPGPVELAGRALTQCDARTCGPAVVVVARAVVDPVFAHALATGTDFGGTQVRVHRAANVFWPRAAGTTPWGVTATLNVHSGAFGVRYGWRAVDDTDPAGIDAALHAATTAAAHGWPVPLLIGGLVPRHYVLLLATPDDRLLCYEPSGGRVVSIAADEIRAGRSDPLGFAHLHALVLPVA